MRDPWAPDAEVIEDSDYLNSSLVKTRDQKNYLDLNHDSQFFVVATKGFGKTHLLMAKSDAYRRAGGFTCIPLGGPGEFREKILLTDTSSFSTKELQGFRQINQWRDLWIMSITAAILRGMSASLPPNAQNLFGLRRSISQHIQILLIDRANFDKHRQSVLNELCGALEGISRPIRVFIDNVDEALGEHVGNSLYEATKSRFGSKNVSEDMWINAQLGLMEAARSLHNTNRHVKIFASIRQEAYEHNPSATASQLDAFSTKLSYTDAELQMIFESRIRLTPPEHLVNPKAEDPLEQFFGLKQIENVYVHDLAGTRPYEDIFRYLLRHTLRRPRDLLIMGSAIARGTPDPKDRTPQEIRKIINKTSETIFEDYKKQVVPYWDTYLFDIAFSHMNSNVLTRADIESIYHAVNHRVGQDSDEHVFCTLHARGLLGVVQEREPGDKSKIQQFRPALPYFSSKVGDLPLSEYYVLHPCLSGAIGKKLNAPFDNNNIIGYGLPFKRLRQSRKLLHTHFGAGNLGLGLVVPLISERSCICMIQRRSPGRDWDEFVKAHADKDKAKVVTVVVPEARRVRFVVIHDELSSGAIESAMEKWKAGEQHVLLISNSRDLIRKFLCHAESLSTAIKDLMDPEFLEHMRHLDSEVHQQLKVFAFENDGQTVADAEREVGGNRIEFVHVVADRVCKAWRISQGSSPEVLVDCETFGAVYLPRCELAERLMGPTALLTSGKDEQEWYYRKKFYLVNEMHAIMAINAYVQGLENKESISRVASQKITIYNQLPLNSSSLRTFAQIQICRLLVEFETFLRSGYYGGKDISQIYHELSKDFEKVFERIQQSHDTVDRLFPISSGRAVSKRWNTRIAGILSFVKNRWVQVGRLGLRDADNIPDQKRAEDAVQEFQHRAMQFLFALIP